MNSTFCVRGAICLLKFFYQKRCAYFRNTFCHAIVSDPNDADSSNKTTQKIYVSLYESSTGAVLRGPGAAAPCEKSALLTPTAPSGVHDADILLKLDVIKCVDLSLIHI